MGTRGIQVLVPVAYSSPSHPRKVKETSRLRRRAHFLECDSNILRTFYIESLYIFDRSTRETLQLRIYHSTIGRGSLTTATRLL